MLNVSVSEARGKFTEILDRVGRGKERIAVGDEGAPLAVLVPVEDLKRLENQAEEALRESAARLQAILDNSPAAIYLKDLEGRFIIAGKTTLEWYGRKPEDVLGRTSYDLVPKEKAEAYASLDREVVRTRSAVTLEEEEVLQDGETHTIIVTKFPVFGPDGALMAIGGVDFDITERKRAEAALLQARGELERRVAERTAELRRANEALTREISERAQTERALRESEARFRDFAEGANDWIWEMDSDFRYIDISPSHEHYSGVPAEDVIGHTRPELYAGVLPELEAQEVEHWREFNRLLEARQAFRNFEQRWVCPDGEVRYFLISAKPVFDAQGGFVGYRGVGSDITDVRRRGEELQDELERQVEERTAELSKSELRLRDVVETLPAGLALYEGEDRLALCNETYRGQVFHDRDSIPFGATFEEILKHKIVRGHYPPAEGRESEWLAERLRVHRETPGPIEQMHSNGRWYWIDERRIGDGSTVVVSTDITERKQAEEELRAAQVELLRQERLATLGQLTATVSHELRNPLGVIRTSVFIVRDGLDEAPARVARSLERIERSVVRCDRIIDEMLDFTRISELEFETVPIDAWLADVLEEQVVPREVTLHDEFGLPGVGVGLDRDRLRRAVINVFDNACQAMVADESERTENGEHRLTVRTGAAAGRVELIFEDTGPGIPPEIHPKVFEPLFSTKGFGVGLGLSVVRQIMEQHGGGIEIENREGGGARVCLWLPGDEPGP